MKTTALLALGAVLVLFALPFLLGHAAGTAAFAGEPPGVERDGETIAVKSEEPSVVYMFPVLDNPYTFIQACNSAKNPATVTVDFYDGSGVPVLPTSSSLKVPGRGCAGLVTATASIASARVETPKKNVRTLVRYGAQPDGTGPGTVFAPASQPDSGPTRYPGADRDSKAVICNPSGQKEGYDAWGYDAEGNQSKTFWAVDLEPYTCNTTLSGKDLAGKKDPPVSAFVQTLYRRSPTPGQWLLPADGSGVEPPEVLAGDPVTIGTEPVCAVAPSSPGPNDRIRFWTWEGRRTFEGELVFFTPAGSPFREVLSVSQIGGFEAMTPRENDDLVGYSAVCFLSKDGTQVAVSGFSVPDPEVIGVYHRSRAPAFRDYYPFSPPAHKKAYAFGIRTSASSTGSLLVFNGSDTTTKVKAIFRRFDGSKIYGRKMNVEAKRLASMTIKQKTRGQDFFVELRVKGKGAQVYAWLRRTDASGDVDTVPAWVIK